MNEIIRIASITDNDSVNSVTGFTLSIFTQGCCHYCKECFSPQTWDYCGGKEMSLDELEEIILNSKCKNVSLIGGDPFYPKNRDNVIKLIKWIKANTNKLLYVWTGYLKEEVEEWIDLKLIDVLIEGKFHIEEKNLMLVLRGSNNQRLFVRGNLSSDNTLYADIKRESE